MLSPLRVGCNKLLPSEKFPCSLTYWSIHEKSTAKWCSQGGRGSRPRNITCDRRVNFLIVPCIWWSEDEDENENARRSKSLDVNTLSISLFLSIPTSATSPPSIAKFVRRVQGWRSFSSFPSPLSLHEGYSEIAYSLFTQNVPSSSLTILSRVRVHRE